MSSAALHAVLAALLSGAWCGCSVMTDFGPDRRLERTEERCSDNVDNDGNGLTDCADSSCQQFDFCKENSTARCEDGVDNDADGRTDCEDDDCCSVPSCAPQPSCGERTVAACTDGIDNDSNGLTDCADFSCDISQCCVRLVPLLAESFGTTGTACTPRDCQTSPRSSCCESPLPAPCNHFDTSRWLAWGLPPPRVAGGAFTPNQPCQDCPASGLVSVVSAKLSPGLHLEFEADLAGDQNAMLSVGFAEKVIVPGGSDLPCGGVAKPYPLLVGIALSGSQVNAVVGGGARGTAVGKLSGTQRVSVDVREDGTVSFAVDDTLFYSSQIKMGDPAPVVRVLLQGWSASATVDNVLVARREGCARPGAWHPGPLGPGAVFGPSTDEAFDTASVRQPSILFDGKILRLYYTGSSRATGASSLGLAWSADGLVWNRSPAPLTIHGQKSDHVSQPMVIADGDGDGYLMAYRVGAPTEPGSLALASSPDAESWSREGIIVRPGTSGWDQGHVGAPALRRFRKRLYLWYVGRGKTSSISSLGLAISDDGSTFHKVKQNPVMTPAAGKQDALGIADPWVVVDGKTLHMWYVGLDWGGQTSVNLAASEDGRNWIRFPSNPLFASGSGALFGGVSVGGPTVLDRWGVLQMWYDGVDSSGSPSIGHAVNGGGS